MVKGEDQITMRLVDEDEFEEQNFSDASVDDDKEEKKELQGFRISRSSQNTTGSCMQVTVYLMFMCVVMGASMLAFHIVARNNNNRLNIIIAGSTASWIVAANVFALAAFVIDKYHAFNSQPRMSEPLALTHFTLGGVVGAWLALCLTCYKPPGAKKKMSGFICRAMICSVIGISIVTVLILRVVLPNLPYILTLTP